MCQVRQSKYFLDYVGSERDFQQEINGLDPFLKTAGAFGISGGPDDLHILPVLDRSMCNS